MIFAVLYWYAVLYGHHFVIETDHRNLVYIHSGSSAKVTRWSLLLQSLSYAVTHIAGDVNEIADELSCAPAHIGHALRLSDFNPPCWPMRLGAVRAVSQSMTIDEDTARSLFLQQHRDTADYTQCCERCSNLATPGPECRTTVRDGLPSVLSARSIDWQASL